MPGYGRHEVIIESPLHNQQIATMSSEAVDVVVETYHRRYIDLVREHQNAMVLIFRNHGPRAGTSLAHPHSQVEGCSWLGRAKSGADAGNSRQGSSNLKPIVYPDAAHPP